MSRLWKLFVPHDASTVCALPFLLSVIIQTSSRAISRIVPSQEARVRSVSQVSCESVFSKVASGGRLTADETAAGSLKTHE